MVKMVEDVDFNHGDFIWSNKAKELVYDQLLKEDRIDLAGKSAFSKLADER